MVLLRSLATVLLAFAGLCTPANAKSSTGSAVLVILEKGVKKESYSTFFGGLEKRGYSLTFREPSATIPLLVKFDVPQYNHVIFFAPTAKTYAPDLHPESLLALMKQKINLIVALSPSQTPMHSFAPEFGLVLPPPGTPLVSHFPKRSGPPTVVPISIPSPGAGDLPILSPDVAGSQLIFSGIPFALTSNPQLVPIIHAPAESFATDTTKDSEAEVLLEAAERGGEGLWAGSSMAVVAGFQTKAGARVVWAGGVEMFGDEFAKDDKNANAKIAQDVASWAFQERGVLRIENVSHHRVGELTERETYTTNDHVVFSLNVTRYDPVKAAWVPLTGITDFQLEFTMLDPHVRTALPPVPGVPGLYQATFRVPDRHGVFKFIVDYRRKGWTHLYSATTVPVVPPRHDEYPRFLSAAWPYYTGAISTSIGFILFCALWLGGAGQEAKKKGKTE